MALAGDPALQGVLLFGGYDPSVAADGDTWLYANGSWTELSAGGSASDPPARWGAAMVWDPVDKYVVMFGGRTPNQFYNDTWVYNSSGWTNVTGAVAPEPRTFTDSFWDPNLKQAVLLGGGCSLCGSSSGWITYNDTWTFVGGTWTNATKSFAPLPPPRRLAVGGWDSVDNESVVYGGTAAQSCGPYNSTYLFTSNWTALSPGVANPGNFSVGQGAWDGIDRYFLDFSGLIPTPQNSANSYCNPPSVTWSFVGGKWTNLTANVSTGAPLGRCCADMAYDAAQRIVVMFGGNTNGAKGASYYGGYINETWTYPVAPLNATILTGAAAAFVGSPVKFTANVSGGMLNFSYNWSFGDGSTNGTTANATHTYSTAGTYVVGLEVVDAQGRSVNRTTTLRVVHPLSSSISATPQLGEAPVKVTFNTTLTGGLSPYFYNWSFGDGAAGNARNLTHVYRSSGTFSATLSLTDSLNETALQSVNITVLGPVAASLVLSSASGIAPFQVNFSGTGSGGRSPYSFTWSFGDGTQVVSGAVVNHTYLAEGTFVANLTVTDALGYSAVQSRTINVYAPMHIALIASTTAGLAPLTVLLTANATGGVPPLTLTWGFGDGTAPASGASTVHTYQLPGIYVANATAIDAQGHRTVTSVSLNAVRPLSLNVLATPTTGATPLTVTFTVQLVGGLAPFNGAWTFGDGTRVSGLNVTHTYTAAGTFTAALTLDDALGESSSQTVKVSTYQPLTVALVAEPATFTLGGSTTLVGSVHGGEGTITFGWTGLPPGCLSKNSGNLACTPNATGSYTVSLNATDSAGELAHASAVLTVQSVPHNGPVPCTVTGTCSNGSSGTSGGGGGVSLPVLVGVVALVAAVALVAGILLARRRPPAPPADPAPVMDAGEVDADAPQDLGETGPA